MTLSYTVMYAGYYGTTPGYSIVTLTGVKNVSFTRNLHPKEDTFQVVLIEANSFPNSSFTYYQEASEIQIYRNDGVNAKLYLFRGIITKIQRDITPEGLQTTLMGYGYWYLLTMRYLNLLGWQWQSNVVVGNPYFVELNGAYNRQFKDIFRNILENVGTSPSGGSSGVLYPILHTTTDLDGTITALSSAAVQGATSISVSSNAFTSNQVIFIGVNSEYNNPSPPQGDIAIVGGVSASSPYVITFSGVVGSQNSTLQHGPYSAGTTVFNNAVYNPLYLSYATLASALEQLVGSITFLGLVGEFLLDFTPATNPILSVKVFNPTASPPAYGIGVDKTNNNSSGNPQIYFKEGESILSLSYLTDIDPMANDMLLTTSGAQEFTQAPVPAEVQSSIDKYGLKQIRQSIGSVVDGYMAGIYRNIYTDYISTPLPTISFNVLNIYDNLSPINPGDVISIYAPSLIGAIGQTNSASTFSMRVRRITRNWSVKTGEQTILDMMFPLTTSGQWATGFAAPTLATTIGKLNQQISNANYNSNSGALELTTFTFSGIVSDRVDANARNYSDFLTCNLNIASQLTQQITNLTNTKINIYSTKITITSSRNNINTCKLYLISPDSNILFNGVVPLNTQIDLLSYITAVTNVASTGINLSKITNDTFKIQIGNAVPPDIIDYTIKVEISFIRDISTNQANSVSQTPFNFTIGVNPNSVVMYSNQTKTITTTTTLITGTTQSVTYAITGIPTSLISAFFSSTSGSPPSSSTLSLFSATFSSNTTYYATVSATGGGITESTSLSITAKVAA